MKHLPFVMMLITLSRAVGNIDGLKEESDHVKQKKQFVNVSPYERDYVGQGNNVIGDGSDTFRGLGSFGGASMFGGSMQLSENSLGGLALDGDGTLAENNLVAATNQLNQFEEPNSRSISSIENGQSLPYGMAEDYSNGGNNYQSPAFFGTYDVNTGNQEDLLSPFYNTENKLEDNINLGDNLNNLNNPGQLDSNAFNENLPDASNTDKGTPIMKAVGSTSKEDSNSNDGTVSLDGELGQLESFDDKLQRLLETSIGSQNDDSHSATVSSVLNALLSHQDQPGSGTNQQHPHAGNHDQEQMQLDALNQLSGTMSEGGFGHIRPVTVHVHASDKPGTYAKEIAPSNEDSLYLADQAQETASKQHKVKLSKLKRRLALLREKLVEMEEEQAKKSMGNYNNVPKPTRNDSIKKLLIKNLRLASLIASKEIQLEEAKLKGLKYITGKKEDDVSFEEHRDKTGQRMFTKSQPLTELSKKAEEEVNNLSKNIWADKSKSNKTLLDNDSPSQNNTASQNDTLRETIMYAGERTLNRINETLQELDKGTTETSEKSMVEARSKLFLNKLQNQIRSMSLNGAHAMEEKALDTLFKTINSKHAVEKSLIKGAMHRNNTDVTKSINETEIEDPWL